jgi:hypothetical protein
MAFAAICNEAAQRHGDDWSAVEQHIRRRVFDLPEEQRQSLANQMDRVLRYCAPAAGAKTQ